MKVAIIGGGAVGLLVAAYLYKADIEPVIYTRRKEQALLLNKYGIEMRKNEKTERYNVKAYCFSDGFKREEDFIILTVKQYDLGPIIKSLIDNKVKTPLLFLQNGMSHISLLEQFDENSVFLGIVEHGVLRLSDYSIVHTGVGQIKIASHHRTSGDMEKMMTALNAIGFKVSMMDDWYPMLVDKLVANAVINPLTAIYKVKNGSLLKNEFFLENMKAVFDEVVQVVNGKEIESLWENVISICKNTSNNYSSMYKDIDQKRQTEIDAILGYLLEEGKKRRKSMPLSQFLYYSIKGMENIGEEEGNG